MIDLTNDHISYMRRVAFKLAKNGATSAKARYALDKIVDFAGSVENDTSFVDLTELKNWKQTFIHDFFEVPLVACKSCNSVIAHNQKKKDACEYCI